jgi:hypothetical protein
VSRRPWALAGAVAAAAAAVGVATSDAPHAKATAGSPPATAEVRRGRLSDVVSQYGILTYRARSDGSPYAAVDRARGTYTALPDVGDEVGCGEVLYRVDDRPVLLLCGPTPAYRSLAEGDSGRDVAELNADLVRLGYATPAVLGDRFGSGTAAALARLQSRRGAAPTGALELGGAVVLPEAVRIARVAGALGGIARPGAPVLYATSDTPEVRVDLDPAQQGTVRPGDRVRVALPGNRQAAGRIVRLGRVAQVADGQDAVLPAYVGFDDPERARGFDRAPVHVDITTKGVADALNVPVTALVGAPGGGFAVEVVRRDGRREPVTVRVGLFDTPGGRVQVAGELRVGDRVVVPS